MRKRLFIMLSAVISLTFCGCATTGEGERLQQAVLAGYDALTVSDYDTLTDMMTDDARLYAVDGSVTGREKLVGLSRRVQALRSGSLSGKEADELAADLAKRQTWAKRARETVEFQTMELTGNIATVRTLDRGTPGKLEISTYTFRRINKAWKLQMEVSTQVPDQP